MMEIIDGKTVSNGLRQELKVKIAALKENFGKTCGLCVIIAGNDPASEIYVRNKMKACEETGIYSETVKLPETVTQEELNAAVKQQVARNDIDGILVQLPLPKGLNEEEALNLIPPEKDVDGLSDENMGRLALGKDTFPSCTPGGIIKLLEYYKIPMRGKHAVVLGRSNIVGKPMALLLLKNDCTVTICHSKTENLKEIVKTADIIVSAVGKVNFVTDDMVKDGAVVIDAGINRNNGHLCGDVDYVNVAKKASFITPVPGGVGPMTVTMLIYNTYESALRKINGRF